MPEVHDLFQVFQDVQSGVNMKSHLSLVKQLIQQHTDVKSQLQSIFELLLAVKRKEKCVENCFKFISSLMQESFQFSEQEQFAPWLPQLLCQEFLCSKDKYVRQNSARLLAQCLSQLNELDADLHEIILGALVERIRDIEPEVRKNVIMALSRFQTMDKSDEELDDVGEVLVFIMQNDPIPDVRKACLINLTVSKATLPLMVERVLDIDESIVKLLYKKLLPPLMKDEIFLNAIDMIRIMNAGVQYTDQNLVLLNVEFIQRYLFKSVEDILSFYESQKDQFLIKEYLGLFFKHAHKFDVNPELVFNEFSIAKGVILQCGMESGLLQDIEVASLAGLLDDLRSQGLSNESIQLVLSSLQYLDLSDEASRIQLLNSVQALVQLITVENLPLVFKSLHYIYQNDADFAAYSNQLMEQLLQEIEAENQNPLEQVTRRFSTSNIRDSSVLESKQLRLLTYIKSTLKVVDKTLEHYPSLLQYLDSVVIPSISEGVESFQIIGIECLSLYSILHPVLAKQNFLFVQSVAESGGTVQDLALKTLYDLLLLYGIEFFVEDGSVSYNDLSSLLYGLFSQKAQEFSSAELLKTVLIGSCRLLLSQNLLATLSYPVQSLSQSLLEQLLSSLLKDPPINQDVRLFLEECLQAFCTYSLQNQRLALKLFQSCLCEKLSRLDQNLTSRLGDYFLQWTDCSKIQQVSNNSEASDVDIYVDSCIGLINDAATYSVEVLLTVCKLLCEFNFPKQTPRNQLDLLLTNIEAVLEDVHEKACIMSLQKLKYHVEDSMARCKTMVVQDDGSTINLDATIRRTRRKNAGVNKDKVDQEDEIIGDDNIDQDEVALILIDNSSSDEQEELSDGEEGVIADGDDNEK
ncbi:hypothetical protein MP228_001927 [Amoeboaphelidium protococcarum]|nr:hypothetical protein MP228_001927 [Amoeboaphelidium protococcarum]